VIADLKPYPKMKDSGVPWLGAVPEHWEALPLGAVARPRKVTNVGYRELLSVYLGRGVIPFSAVDQKRTNPTSDDLSKYQAVEPGDFVLNNQQAWRGSVGVSRYSGIVSPAYLVLILGERLDREFADRLLSSRVMIAQYLVCSKGVGSIQRNLYWPHLRRVSALVPPIEEQGATVRFLDHADRRVRRYIRTNQNLIKLLEEQKQAIIHWAVTRGLDPNVRLKPSGVEWLGDVPEHWDVLALKRIAWFKSGAGFPVGEQGNQGAEIPFLRVSDMTRLGNETWIETPDSTVSRETAQRLGAYIFPAGSIIFPKVGGALLTNKRRLLRMPSCIDNNVMGCVVRGADLDYAFTLLQQLDLGRLAKPGPVPAIGEGDVREIKVALPPSDEQRLIVSAVRSGTASLVSAISSAQGEIDLLREYRTRLIADVVTGKLDVREAAARLPDEPDEPEPLDEIEAEDETDEAGADNTDEVPEEAEA
jgi:type I restriction enzyme S subunit